MKLSLPNIGSTASLKHEGAHVFHFNPEFPSKNKIFKCHFGLGCSLVGRVLANIHEPWIQFPVSHKPSMVAHTRNPHTLEMDSRK